MVYCKFIRWRIEYIMKLDVSCFTIGNIKDDFSSIGLRCLVILMSFQGLSGVYYCSLRKNQLRTSKYHWTVDYQRLCLKKRMNSINASLETSIMYRYSKRLRCINVYLVCAYATTPFIPPTSVQNCSKSTPCLSNNSFVSCIAFCWRSGVNPPGCVLSN